MQAKSSSLKIREQIEQNCEISSATRSTAADPCNDIRSCVSVGNFSCEADHQ